MSAATPPIVQRARLARPAHLVAPDLLGCLLHVPAEGILVRIIEVEAYEAHEPASHTFRGRTPSNAVMFGRAGHLYTYFTYGMHWCANVVTGVEEEGQAVLLRAGRLLAGEAAVRVRRGTTPTPRDLLRGPARLARALDLDRSSGGIDLLAAAAPLRLLDRDAPAPPVVAGPRVGVRLAADLPWRFAVADDPLVSPYRRHPKAGDGPFHPLRHEDSSAERTRTSQAG